MKTIICIVMLVLGMAVVGCSQTTAEVDFVFTASGDDGDVGQASFYDIRYSTDSLVLIAWDNALQVQGEPTPKIAGSDEFFTLNINVVSEKTYYFALRVGDNNNNWSVSSNIISINVPDLIPPAMVINFQVVFR